MEPLAAPPAAVWSGALMLAGSLDLLRRARLRALLARSLANGGDVWRAYDGGGAIPALRFRDGATLHHEPGDSPIFLFFEIFANGCYRRHLRAPVHGIVVDIGANIGAFTLDIALRHPDLRIDAYEPNPTAFQTLQRNVEANALQMRVRLYREAVGEASGVRRLWLGDGSITATAHPSARASQGHTIEVPQVDLATVLGRAGRVGVLKIDAEGAEAEILEGGRDRLRDVDQIIAEYHESLVPGVLQRVEAVLRATGFEPIVCRNRRCGALLYASRG